MQETLVRLQSRERVPGVAHLVVHRDAER